MEPFDPLSLENIGVTLAVELLEQPLAELPPKSRFTGAGVYALYYSGAHPAYKNFVRLDKEKGRWKYPVYIGSAVRENAKQGFSPRPTSKERLWSRLNDHAKSIAAVQEGGMPPALKLKDFRCRFLTLNDTYIGLAESVLITAFRPAWNGMGLGSKVVGVPRMMGKGSLWDALHPGRKGRPEGTALQREFATAKITESIRKLTSSPPDEKVAKMLEKITRFL